MGLLAVAAAAVPIYLVYRLAKYIIWIRCSPMRDLRGPKPRSLLMGDMKRLWGEDNFPLLQEWESQFGPTFVFKAFFASDRLFTMDPRAINHVFTHSVSFQKNPQSRAMLTNVLGDGILVMEGDHHKKQRRIMNPCFGPSSIRDMLPIFFQKAEQLRDMMGAEIDKQADGSVCVDVLTWLSRATLDIIGLAGFNYNLDALSISEKPNELAEAFKQIFHNAGSFSLLQIAHVMFPITRKLFRTPRVRKEDEAKRTMLKIGEELLRERKQRLAPGSEKHHDKEVGATYGSATAGSSVADGRDLLTALVRANMASDLDSDGTINDERTSAQRMTDAEVIAQVPTFLTAGHETTATGTTWALYALARCPDVQRKLRAEAIAHTRSNNGANPDISDGAMPYLDAFVHEALRLYAPVPATVRMATHDTDLPLAQGVVDRHGVRRDVLHVRKGEMVYIPILGMNTSKAIWGPDALEFNPDRWNDVPAAARDIPGLWGNTLTFLGGARSCIGYRFALMEMKALLVTLVRGFEFELSVPAEDIECRSLVVTRPYLRGAGKGKGDGAQLPLILRRVKEL